jgi:hypothetical protein
MPNIYIRHFVHNSDAPLLSVPQQASAFRFLSIGKS